MLPLASDGRSLLVATVDRLAGLVAPEDCWVCTTRALAPQVVAELPTVEAHHVLGEPAARNTAPAIAWAVAEIGGTDPVVVLPADHRIEDEAAFRRALALAAAAATAGSIVTLGIRPRAPETGFGYLEVGEGEVAPGVGRVRRFVEKPDRATAERFLAAGNYLWNAGIFVFRPDILAAAVARCLPALAEGLEQIRVNPEQLDQIWATLPATSIDHGVMEKLDDIAVVPFDGGWSDLGSWDAVHELEPQDGSGNAIVGRGLALAGTTGSLLFAADGITVTAIGIEDLVVVATRDAVLVVPRTRCQDVRAAVAALEAADAGELL